MQLVSVVLFALAIEAVGSFSVCPTLKSHVTINHFWALSMQETGDPRIDEADSTFKAIMGGVGAAFGGLAKAKNARATHTFGSTGRGRLTVLSQPDIPAHKYLASNRSYPVLVRHANIKGFKDDAIRDGRGLTLRLLAGDADAATDALDLHDAVLDVLTSTGPRFFLNNAMAFSQWVRSDLDGRGAMLIAYPKIVPIFEEIIKNPDSYTKLHYYSEPSYIFVAEDGSKFYMRYRIINADKSADTGSVPTEEVLMPLDYVPRPESDTRAETYLQDDFRSRVTSQSGVSYLLQLQLCEVSKNLAANEEKMDCTIPWDEYHFPMRDVALIHLDEVVPDEAVEPLNFSPFHAPAELGLVLASTAKDMASINHMRSVVYEFSAKNRNGQPLPDHLAALIPQRK